jgi:hypothetical protein
MKNIIALSIILLTSFSGSIMARSPLAEMSAKASTTKHEMSTQIEQEISAQIDSLVRGYLEKDHHLGLMCDDTFPQQTQNAIVIYQTAEGKYCTLYHIESATGTADGEMSINF